jgi:hypothetical protein
MHTISELSVSNCQIMVDQNYLADLSMTPQQAGTSLMPKTWIITTNPLQKSIEEGRTLERRDVRWAD